jgi:hypothetical protein
MTAVGRFSDEGYDPFEQGPIVPDGYVRSGDGRWRYQVGNDLVPGARDICLERLWKFPTRDGLVFIPLATAEAASELAWCRDWAQGRTIVDRRRGVPAHEAWMIPVEEWSYRSRIPLGLDAPELAPSRLIGVAAVARLAGVEEASVRAWASRGVLPAPVLPAPPGPAWSLPVVLRVLANRPGQGRRSDEPRSSRTFHSVPVQSRVASSPHRASTPHRSAAAETFAEQMAHLDAIRKRSTTNANS